MKREEILKKAIEKAVKGGYDVSSNKNLNWYNAMGCWTQGYLTVEQAGRLIIFSHDFAKAFWKDTKQLEKDGICLHCGVAINIQTYSDRECNHIYYPEGCKVCGSNHTWQYHLQQMVISEDPISYLEKFL